MDKNFIMSFSSGKDSILSLYKMIKNGYKPVRLLTTISGKEKRSLFHGVNVNLLENVSEALDIPLVVVDASGPPYGEAFEIELGKAKDDGINLCAFGDIDIIEHQNWGKDRCKAANIDCIWPLWNENRISLVREFVSLGFKAKIKILNTRHLSEQYLAQDITSSLIDEFVGIGLDPSAESGEFHTFVYDGPIFKHKVDFKISDIHRIGDYSMLDFLV